MPDATAAELAEVLGRALKDAADNVRRARLGLIVPTNGHQMPTLPPQPTG